ncbi:hypothetical protein HJFPF1_12505 [Paramyrothecium foliicola]|nr:hypothetical protein HJFPF1_12505 [Paramyrothecium foliicola]
MSTNNVSDGTPIESSDAHHVKSGYKHSTTSSVPEPVSPATFNEPSHTVRAGDGVTLGRDESEDPATQHLVEKSRMSSEEDKPLKAVERRHTWDLIWLTTPVLVLFAVTFTLMMLATILLYVASQTNNGVGAPKAENYYGWKYGPTAGKSDETSVDYWNKILMPWKELQEGPATAEKTLLLDYVSPILPLGLWRAMKNRHWAVALSTFGSALILVSTVLSTGLLVLEPTSVQFHREVPVSRGFRNARSSVIDSWAAQVLYSVYFHNLSYPLGTTEDGVFPTIDTANMPDRTRSWIAQTEALQIECPCEAYTLGDSESIEFREDPALRSDIRTNDCFVKDVLVSYMSSFNLLTEEDIIGYWGLVNIIDCDLEYHTWPGETGTDMARAWRNTSDPRIMFSVTKRALPDGDLASQTIHPDNVTVVICKPSYFLQTVQIQPAQAPDPSTRISPAFPETKQLMKQLVGFFNGHLAYAVVYSMQQWSKDLHNEDPSPEIFGIKKPGWMEFMALKEHLDRNATDKDTLRVLSDPDVLARLATKTFIGVAAQFMNHVFMGLTTSSVPGQLTAVENRLQVTKESTIQMSLSFGLLAAIAIAIVFLRPISTMPWHPTQTLSLAAILSHSPRLEETLANFQAARVTDAQNRMAAYRFRMVPSSGDAIAISMQNPVSSQSEIEKDLDKREYPWWHPIASRNWFLGLLVLLPVAATVALEILQRESDKNEGIMDLAADRTTLFTTYIPAAAALCIASMYSSMEFVVAISAPFVAMKNGGATCTKSIDLSFTRKLLPRAFYLAIKSRHFGVAMALGASFIGGFLTIVISGLYRPVEIPQFAQVQLNQQDVFHVNKSLIHTWTDDVRLRRPLLEYAGIEYSKDIYQDLVFNHWKEPSDFSDVASSDNILKTRLPATRAQLNCTPISMKENHYNLTARISRAYLETVDVNLNLPAADWCGVPPPRNSTSESISRYLTLSVPSLETGGSATIGKVVFLRWDYTIGVQVGSPSQCPLLMALAGKIWLEERNETKPKLEADLGALLCYQNVVQVDADVSLTIPDLGFDPSQRPMADEASVQLLKSESGSHRLDLDLGQWTNRFKSPIHESAFPNTLAEKTNIDGIFRALVDGRYAQPFEVLGGEKNAKKLATALSAAYGRYMAQHISKSLRMDKESNVTLALGLRNGTVALASKLRLQQNEETKLALQVMLSVMAACALVTRVLMPTSQVFHYNPCSIFGIAMLLAGSSLVEDSSLFSNIGDAGAGSGHQCESFEGKTFSLKQWSRAVDRERSERWYGIDVDQEEKLIRQPASAETLNQRDNLDSS